MAAKVEIILQGTDNASRPIRDVNQALTEVGEKGKGSFGILQSAASSALGFIGAQAGIAFTGMVGSAVSAGAEYGAVMNRIQAVSGATAGEMDLINKQALKLGADLPISAADAAQGMYALVTAGYSAKDAIAASGGVAALAASQQMEVGRASEIVSAALRGFGLEADQAGRVTDLLSQTASRSAVEVADVGETLKYVGPVAGALKQPMEDVAVAIGLMGNAGVKGEMAGTALRSMLSNMAAPTKEASGVLNQLGIEITNTDGTMRPLTDIMQQFRDKTAGMTDTQKASVAQTIAGKEAMSGFLAIVGASQTDFDGMKSAMENANGATDRFASSMNKGLKFEIEQLKGSIETVLIQGFQAVEPVMVSVVSAITPLVNQVGENLPGAMAAAQTAWDTVLYPAFQTAGAFISTNVVPVLMTLGLWLQTNVPVAVAAASDAWTTTLYPALQTAWGFIQANIIPVLATLVGWLADNLPGAIAVVVGHWDTLAKIAAVVGAALGAAGLVGVITTVVGVVGTFITAAAGLWATLTAGGAVVTAIGALIALLGGPITIVVGLIAALAVAWSTNLFGIRDKTEEVWNAITTFTSTFWTNLSGAWTRNVEEIRSAWNGWTASLSAAWDNWHSGVQTAVATFWGNLVGAWERNRTDIRTAWDGWTSSLSSAWDTWHTSVSGAVTTWWGGVKDKWGQTQDAVRSGWDSWKDGLASAWDTWQANILALASAWWGVLSAAWDTALAGLRAYWDTWSAGLSAAWSVWQATVQGAVDVFWAAVRGLWQLAQGDVRGAWDTWSGGLSAAWSTWQASIQGAVDTFRGQVVGSWTELGESLKRLWGAAWSAIQTAVGTLGGQVVEAVRTLITNVVSAWSETDWGKVGSDVIEGIKNGIASGVESIRNAARNAAQAALDAAKNALGISSPSKVMADEVGKPIVDGIVVGLQNGEPALTDAAKHLVGQMVSIMADLAAPLVAGEQQFEDGTVASLVRMVTVTWRLVEFMRNANAALAEVAQLSEINKEQRRALVVAMKSVADFMVDLGKAIHHVIDGVENDVEPSLTELNKVFGATVGVLGSTMTLVNVLLDSVGGTRLETALNDGPMRQWLINLAQAMVQWASDIGNAVDDVQVTVDETALPGLKRLADILSPIKSAIDGTVGIALTVLKDVTPQSFRDVLGSGEARAWIAQLVQYVIMWANEIGSAADDVQVTVDEAALPGLKRLSDILSPIKSNLDNALGIVKLLGTGFVIPGDIGDRSRKLTQAAMDVGKAALAVANAFDGQVGAGATAASAALPLVGKMLQDAIALLRVVAEGGTVGGADAVKRTLSALATLLTTLVDASRMGGLSAGESWADAFMRGAVDRLLGWTPFPPGKGGAGGEGGLLGEFASGGAVGRTGRYLLHAGEVVMNPQQQARLAANLVGANAGEAGPVVVNNYYTYNTENKTTNVSMSNSTAEASRASTMSIYGLVMYS